MTTWTVFKKEVVSEPGSVLTHGWIECGTYDSTSPYWLGGGAAQTIGEEQGAGEYLLLLSDTSGDRYKRITVVERTVYEEEVPPEPVGDSVEEIMEREG